MDKALGLVASTWRSGSRWLFLSFKDAYRKVCPVHHEGPLDVMVARPGINIGWPIFRDLEGYYACFDRIPLVHIVRNPVDVARSAVRNGLAKRPDAALGRWLITHRTILDLKKEPYWRYRIEDIWRAPEELHNIAVFFALPRSDALMKYHMTPIASAAGAATVPRFELGKEVIELAERFGYAVPVYAEEHTCGHDTTERDRKRAMKHG